MDKKDFIKEFDKLQKENEKIRNKLDKLFPIDNLKIWELVNELINNEIEQEELCEQ